MSFDNTEKIINTEGASTGPQSQEFLESANFSKYNPNQNGNPNTDTSKETEEMIEMQSTTRGNIEHNSPLNIEDLMYENFKNYKPNQIPSEPEDSEEINPEISELRNEVRALNQRVLDLTNMVQNLLDNRVTPSPEPIPSPAPNQGTNVEFTPFPEVGTSQVNNVNQNNPTPNSDNLPPTDPFPVEFVDKGLETPEQKLIAVTKKYDELNNRTNLTSEETLEKQRLLSESFALNQQINKERTETDRKRERKEKIVKIVAGVAGAGLAIATPPVAIAAVLGVTLGGRIATPLIKYGSNKLRERSNNAKYENRIGLSPDELDKLDKKIKRNEWWANRLGELAAVVDGGTIGYGLGKFAQNMFGWKGINFDGNNIDTPKLSSDVSAYDKQAFSRYNNQLGQNTPNIPQTPTGGEIPTASTDSVLVNNGRVDLPGSAWNGNLANQAAQDILTGGELNFSNYNGGIEEMAAHMLEKDLAGNITRDQLLNNLSTPEVHRLLNLYKSSIETGITDPNLTDMLGKLGTDGAKNLLNIIK